MPICRTAAEILSIAFLEIYC